MDIVENMTNGTFKRKKVSIKNCALFKLCSMTLLLKWNMATVPAQNKKPIT
jgi:hypothetical protein